MKSVASIDQPILAGSAAEEDLLAAVSGRLTAYVSLTKPRLVLLVLVTVAVGFLLGSHGNSSRSTFLSLAATLVGTSLVAGGAGALNQWLERERDARMRRTSNRAFPPDGWPPRKPRSLAVSSFSWGRRSCSRGQTWWRPRSRS